MVARCSESNGVCLLIRTLVDIPNVLIFNGALRYDAGFATIGGIRQAEKTYSVYFYAPIRASLRPYRNAGQGSNWSHCWSGSKVPKSLPTLTLSFVCNFRKVSQTIIRRLFCLYHDLLDRFAYSHKRSSYSEHNSQDCKCPSY